TAMNELQTILAETCTRLFTDHATTAVLEAAEKGQWPAALWQALEENGLTLPQVPEALRGAGAAGGDDAGGRDPGRGRPRRAARADDGGAGARGRAADARPPGRGAHALRPGHPRAVGRARRARGGGGRGRRRPDDRPGGGGRGHIGGRREPGPR